MSALLDELIGDGQQPAGTAQAFRDTELADGAAKAAGQGLLLNDRVGSGGRGQPPERVFVQRLDAPGVDDGRVDAPFL
ncbi:hypothetical protein SDC9_205895 [bioreactor metagenome]|uniref:Uncharacterized protein n=1 Tax=bioreactor metagenome TaxID=1076179 RepID=A0A645JCR1_9ZZZZ